MAKLEIERNYVQGLQDMKHKPRILIVDDNRSLVRAAERVLQNADFDVLTAFDGMEGLERAREEKPDLIILDIVMPRMDGYEFCVHLQQDPDTARVPLIILSTTVKIDERGELLATGTKEKIEACHAGTLDFLSKPVMAKKLVERAKVLLRPDVPKANNGERLRDVMNSKSRILIVDDDHSLVRVAERVLQKEGFEVLTAFDGMEGLQKAREEQPDLVILDLVMPGTDGYEVCQLMQKDPGTRRIPVVVLSRRGRVDEEGIDRGSANIRAREQQMAFQAGAIDFLSKPIAAKELVARVKSALWFGKIEQGSVDG
jgi:CheY-like chemotaxis protein